MLQATRVTTVASIATIEPASTAKIKENDNREAESTASITVILTPYPQLSAEKPPRSAPKETTPNQARGPTTERPSRLTPRPPLIPPSEKGRSRPQRLRHQGA